LVTFKYTYYYLETGKLNLLSNGKAKNIFKLERTSKYGGKESWQHDSPKKKEAKEI